MSIIVNGKRVAGLGIPGKSAYQAAVEGGYTGTESEFNQHLAGIGDADYDPSGTAASAVSTHNADPAAHPDLRQAIAGALTATAQITYNGGAA